MILFGLKDSIFYEDNGCLMIYNLSSTASQYYFFVPKVLVTCPINYSNELKRVEYTSLNPSLLGGKLLLISLGLYQKSHYPLKDNGLQHAKL